MLKILLGLLLGLCIGIGCRWFDVPLPAPPNLVGALIIVSITLGYIGTDYLLAQHAKQLSSVVQARPTFLRRATKRSSREEKNPNVEHI